MRLIFDRYENLSNPGCQDLGCVHTSSITGGTEIALPKPNEPIQRLDGFLFGLLTTCHSRASDVLDTIIASGRVCATVAAASTEKDRSRVRIPALRVGSFVASAASSSSMQAALITHITTVFAGNMRRFGERVAAAFAEAGEDEDKQRQLMTLRCELLEERNRRQIADFDQIGDGLTKMDSIK
ncbi:hypothetical protein F5Y15DRAFT_266550 [Xylariaceae sp. FL0016]|nr:hypothetical protein F5Y15DRAFT_266550 [Xylariaceae sp. FL0016]